MRRIFLFCASVVFLIYVLAPVAWLLSSSFQGEAEITSRPPHWVPHQPTLENFEAIFQAREKKVTYETRRAGDPATGGYIPSTARDLIPSMWNSLVVAVSVVILNLLVGVPAARGAVQVFDHLLAPQPRELHQVLDVLLAQLGKRTPLERTHEEAHRVALQTVQQRPLLTRHRQLFFTPNKGRQLTRKIMENFCGRSTRCASF